MAGKQTCLIVACPIAKMLADKDTDRARKQRAAVRPLIDNSLSERSASEEEQADAEGQRSGLNTN